MPSLNSPSHQASCHSNPPTLTSSFCLFVFLFNYHTSIPPGHNHGTYGNFGHESGQGGHLQQVARLRNKARGQGNASPGPSASLAAATGVQVNSSHVLGGSGSSSSYGGFIGGWSSVTSLFSRSNKAPQPPSSSSSSSSAINISTGLGSGTGTGTGSTVMAGGIAAMNHHPPTHTNDGGEGGVNTTPTTVVNTIVGDQPQHLGGGGGGLMTSIALSSQRDVGDYDDDDVGTSATGDMSLGKNRNKATSKTSSSSSSAPASSSSSQSKSFWQWGSRSNKASTGLSPPESPDRLGHTDRSTDHDVVTGIAAGSLSYHPTIGANAKALLGSHSHAATTDASGSGINSSHQPNISGLGMGAGLSLVLPREGHGPAGSGRTHRPVHTHHLFTY